MIYSLVSEANPGLWLAKEENAHTSVVEEGQEKSEELNSPPKEPVTVPDKSQEAAPNPRPVQQARGAELTFSGKISGVPLPSPAPDVPGGAGGTPPETPDRPAPGPNEPSGPEQERMTESGTGRPAPSQSLWARLWHRPSKTLLWDALLLLLCVAVVVVVRLAGGFKEARQWTARMNARLRPRRIENDGILTLHLNDQPHRLGRLDQIKEVHVGSGEQNTIRIPDKSLADRLLSLCGKANGLMLRNLSSAPLDMNGHIVKPGRSAAVVLGSPIKLNERFTLTPELVRPQSSPNAANNRSHQDGPAQQ